MLARVASEREAVPRADGPREEGRRERKLRKRSEKPLKCEESPLQETGVQLELRGFSHSSKPRYHQEGYLHCDHCSPSTPAPHPQFLVKRVWG